MTVSSILRRTAVFSPRIRRFSSSAMATVRPGEKEATVSDAHRGPTGVIDIPLRYLMGPGPGNAHPRVLAAQSMPLLGHMHPPFLAIMDEIRQGLQYLFQTKSPYTLCVSGTGHAGMEACIASLLEPGETILVGNKGIWGARVVDMSRRFGANVVEIKAEAGHTFDPEALAAQIGELRPAVVFLVQGDSSTGVHQSLKGLGDACRAAGTLLLVDTVCSQGGVPFFFDEWGVDAVYTGSQKCLSAPPCGAPIALSERAVHKLQNRKTPVRSYYFDLNLVGNYWGWFGARAYHHTGMVSNWYAMREALAVVSEEGLRQTWDRHAAMHALLWQGLERLGLKRFVPRDEDRLVTVNTVAIPEGVDGLALCKFAMDTYNLEIAGGLGPTAGKVWRVGLLGYNARPAMVELVIKAFEQGLQAQGFKA